MSSLTRTPQPQIGALLRMAWTEAVDEIFTELAAAGYDDLRRVHRPIIRHLLLEGQRPTELATALGLSKQAINDILREFQNNGYIDLESDPSDRRAKRIVVTDRGRRLATAASALSHTVGQRWARQVGEDRYAIFEAVLREITTDDHAEPSH